MMKYCFGVDVGGTTVKLGLFTVEGELLDKWEIKTYTENEGERILPDVAEAIKGKIAEKLLKAEEICGIGVGVPAPVDKNGAIERAANVGWMAKEIKKELEELTGFPCVIGNDANVAALGEMWKGAGEGEKDLIMVTLGTGVGGGIIINGEIAPSHRGVGGELGHITVNPDEEATCNCGNHGLAFHQSFVIFTSRNTISNDTSASSNINLTAFIHSHADTDTYVHVTGEIDITYSAAVYTARAFFKFM